MLLARVIAFSGLKIDPTFRVLFWPCTGVDLPHRHNRGQADAFVTLLAGKERKKLASTCIACDSLDFARWSFETCVLLPDLDVLTFQLYHHNTLFKNELLGTATLYLTTVSNLQGGATMRLKLEGAERGELVVLVRALAPYAGMPIDTSMFYTARPYAPIRLHLERYVWVPGELVRGCVIWTGAGDKRLDWLHLESSGRTHFEFRSQQGLGLPARQDFATKCFITPFNFLWWSVSTKIYDSTEKIVKPNMPSATSGADGNTSALVPVGNGMHVWPFEFVLPARLPPTYTRQSFSSTYTFRVHAQVDGRIVTASKDVAIVPPLTAYRASLSSPILAAVAPNIVAPSQNEFTLSWGVPEIVQIGVPFVVSFQLENASTSQFTGFTCHLRTLRVYNMYSESRKEWMANSFLEEISSATVPGGVHALPHAAIAGQVQMLAENTATLQCCYPSVPEEVYSDLLQIHHWLELFGTTATGQVISIGKRPIFVTYSQFIPPFESTNVWEPTPPNSPVAYFRIAKAPFEHAYSLCIPQGHWVHKHHALTQEKSSSMQPQLCSTSTVLSHQVFESLHPITPKHTASATSQTIPFPYEQTTPIRLEHAESFEGNISAPSNGKPRPGEPLVTVNSNLGVNLNYQAFSLDDLNRSIFTGGFGK